MAANGRMTRSLARQQSAYEDQARDIQKRIITCREAYRDAQEFLQDERPDANDTTQRKTQLIAQYRANITQLNLHAANLVAAGTDWIALMRTFDIPHGDSDWADRMRRQHDTFFAQAPNLDFQLRELIHLYRNAIQQAQQPEDLPPSPELGRGLQPTLLVPQPQVHQAEIHHDGSSEDGSTGTQASNGANGASPATTPNPAYLAGAGGGTPNPAYLAGAGGPQETPSRHDSDASSTPTVQTAPRRRVRIQETPTDIATIEDLSLRDEDIDSDEFYDAPSPTPVRRTSTRTAVDAERSATSTPQQAGRQSRSPIRQHPPSPYGIFAQGDGLYTDARPMAWHNAHTGNGQHHENFFYASSPAPARTPDVQRADRTEDYRRSPLYLASLPAANAAPADRAAYLAVGNAGDGIRSRQPSAPREPSPQRTADPATRAVHRERLQHVLQDARPPPPPGRGRYDAPAFASAPPAPDGPTAWTMQPPPSTAPVHHRPPSPVIDHGADFGRENASKFYQNGTYQRTTSVKPPPVVLKELPIKKFSGDIRHYPVFRNGFLETVGGRNDMEPHYKFQHLLTVLEGEPHTIASGYLITDTNYFKVLDRFEERYGNKTKLATLLTQDFYALKPAGSSAKDLRRFHDAALRTTDEMEQIGEDIPMHIRTEICKNLGKDPLTVPVHDTLERISDYLRVLESSDVACPWMNATEGNSGRGGLPCRPDPRSTNHRAGTYATEADATHAANLNDRRCAYCGRDHWSLRCDIYKTIAQRLRRIEQLGHCFLCLKGGHWSGKCPKRTKEACRFCHIGQHHQSLCRKTFPSRRPPFTSLRTSPVRAPTTSGGKGILKIQTGGSSSQQAARDRNPVTWAGANGQPPATTSCPPSAQLSSETGKSNSKQNRHKKSKGNRTDPKGRNGTTRPTTACIDENVIQMDANACGGDGPLSGHQSHLQTDRRSTPAEAPWYDRKNGNGSDGSNGIPDVCWERVPSDEEASLPESTGHCSDVDTEPDAEEQWADDPSWFGLTNVQDYSGYAVSTTSPADNHAVLLECLRTTAVNTTNGLSRPAIVFFDGGSNSSYIAMKLAQELRLPCLEKRYLRVHTFGTDATTTIAGFATSVILRSPQGYTVALTLTASDRIVPPVTTALVENDEVALLRKNDCALISTRETPDLLIGQDLLHLFDRRFGPKLPSGFSITWTCLGPMAGGAGKVASHRKAASTTIAAVSSDPEPPEDVPIPESEPPSDTSNAPPPVPDQSPLPTPSLGYNPEDPLNLWTLDDLAPDPTYLVGKDARGPTSDPTYLVGAEGGDSTVVDASTHLCGLIGESDAELFGDFSHVENAGIGTNEMTPDDQAAADMLKKIHKRHPDGRYEVPLLFRTPDGEPPTNKELPTNSGLAKGRSFSTRKMLVPHPKKLLDYHSVILDWKERGFLKEAPKTTPHTKHVLSHHPVFKETSTTTATRPVYDASAKLPGQSCLNDWLYRGPILLPDVAAILLRSRPPKIVILADISKAFLQMEVKESHKDCLRFYWFRDPFKEPTDDNLVEYRFERVPFGLKSAPYLLAGVIKLHLERVGTPLALEMLKNCYVDNVLLTADTVDAALAKYREAKKIFAQIGMPLREFASNSTEVNAAIDPADRADLTKLKELGIRWDILSDYWDIPLMPKQAPSAYLAGGQACLAASPAAPEDPAYLAGTSGPGPATQKKRSGPKKKDESRLTKRNMLRLLARLYDPQGLAQAATLLAKLAIQEAWKEEKDWDDEITGELAALWIEAIKDFDTTVIRVPRRIAEGKTKSAEIHVFTDGSSYAYGFTAYLRVKNADGTYSTNLVYSRARVKPIKDAEKFTIPRMELLGVLLGTRIAAFLHKELLLPITATYLWSDSTIVLHQVANNEAIKEVWTENRLKEIRHLRDTLKIQFRHVPTAENPADIVSRGIPAAELQKCEMWWHGAPFLALDSSRWPEQPTSLRTKPSPSDKPTELYGSTAFTTLYLGLPSKWPRTQWIRQRSQRKKANPLDTIAEPLPPTYTTTCAVVAVAEATYLVAKPPKLPSEPILPRAMEEKFDRWPRLVRIQYYVIRFAAACLRRLNQRRHAPALGFELGQCFTTLGRKPTLRDLHLVTMIILRKTQLRHPPSAADSRNLGIFESQGLLYVKGRLGNMKLRPTALTPLYLPREARETELIILDYHRINGHAGVTVTLANLRMRYWFTKGRSTIRNVLRKYCFACRRESMHPFAVPPWPQLPTSRVTNARPFFFTGLDFFGPVYLRALNGSGAYYVAKYYVCIFVCMTLRCIHLELCDDLSTDAFLHAFKRFGYRREFPRRILSDNGLSFITAREVINRIRGRPAHQQPVKRTLPIRKAVSARLAARQMQALAAASSTEGTQQRRPTYLVGRTQQLGAPTYLVGPSAVLASHGNRSPPTNATLTRDEENLVDFCQRHNIEWQTITELSPWKGGVYERLIGLIKHCLRRSIGNTKPTVVEFNSLLLCAEHTANSRPLSYVADSDTDFFLIRPLDFLIPMLDQEAHQYPLDPAADDYSPDDPDFVGPGENKLHAKLVKDLTKARKLADSFWQTFRDGTLLELRNRGIDRKRKLLGEQTIQPGDLVLVSEKDVPRSEWRLALVLEPLPHSDGLIRSARIRYANTKRETNRSLEHLYPIGKIPQSTAACSTVSRLGITLSVLLSDIVSMPDQPTTQTITTAATAPPATAQTSTVPISAAGFDTTGEFVLSDLTPPSAAMPTGQSVSGPAYLAGTGTTEPAAKDDSVPTYLVGRESPEPQASPDAEPIILTAPRPLLFDPLTIQIEHHRQMLVALDEKQRIWNVLFTKFKRCLELDAAGLPSDKSYARLTAEMERRLGPLKPSSLAGPSADPLADQNTQTETTPEALEPAAAEPLDAQPITENAEDQEQDAEEADEPELEADEKTATWLEDNAKFWEDITVTGVEAPADNPFLNEPPPSTSATMPVSRDAPTTSFGAKDAAEERQRQESSNGTDAAYLAVPLPAVESESGAAYLAVPVPAPQAPVNQVPFNGRALLRARPMNMNWPDFPSLETMELRARQFFAHYVVADQEDPPILEPIDEGTLFTRPAERAQKSTFIVIRNNVVPIWKTTWDPIAICNGDGEQDGFHRPLRRLRIIQASRWASTGAWKKNLKLKDDLQKLLDRTIPTFGHMLLLTYVARLYNKYSNVSAMVSFLNQLLDSTDFDEDIPELLAFYHQRLIVGNTREPWPTTADLKTAAKRWLCYCQHAYHDIFERLSGPIVWSPEWMRNKVLPSAARQAFDKMATDAALVLDTVRQMVYRQYGLKHVLAVLDNAAHTYEWQRIDHIPDRDLVDADGLLAFHKTICFVDKYTAHYFGAALKERIALHIIPATNSKAAILAVIKQYPSREVDRVIWWFGTDYTVNHGNEDYGALVAHLSHHYAAYFGYPEQIVIAPTYARTQADSWTSNVLGLLVQQQLLLPHARLIIDAHDLRMWRHDYYPTSAARASKSWPSEHLSPDGRLRTPHIVELRKYHLRKYHGLDLWTYYEADAQTAPMPKSILDRTTTGGPLGDFTEPGIVKVGAYLAPSETPSTSSQAQDVTYLVTTEEPAPTPISATIAEQTPRVPDAAALSAATASANEAPAIAASAANQAVPATITDVESRIAPLVAEMASLKDLLLDIKAALQGPSSSKRLPDTDPELDD